MRRHILIRTYNISTESAHKDFVYMFYFYFSCYFKNMFFKKCVVIILLLRNDNTAVSKKSKSTFACYVYCVDKKVPRNIYY